MNTIQNYIIIEFSRVIIYESIILTFLYYIRLNFDFVSIFEIPGSNKSFIDKISLIEYNTFPRFKHLCNCRSAQQFTPASDSATFGIWPRSHIL